MSRNVIIGLVIAAVVIIGGGIWYATSRHTVAPSQSAETGTEPTTSPSGSGSIADLMRMTGTYQCDVHSVDTKTSFTGKVYVSDGRMRVDSMVATSASKTITAHMIKADGFLYTWSDLMPRGIKIPDSMVQTQATTTTQPSTQTQGVSTNTQVSYSCVPWVIDGTVFTPPTNVTFMTIPTSGAGVPTGTAVPMHATY